MAADENSEHEPSELLHDDLDDQHDGTTFEMVAKAHHELDDSDGGGEGRMALVDTACTSCMHSKAWRIAYSKTLPEGHQCERTASLMDPTPAAPFTFGGFLCSWVEDQVKFSRQR